MKLLVVIYMHLPKWSKLDASLIIIRVGKIDHKALKKVTKCTNKKMVKPRGSILCYEKLQENDEIGQGYMT